MRRRLARSFDAVAVIAVFALLIVLPAGMVRLSSADVRSTAGLRGTVSVLEVRGPSDTHAHPVWVWRPPGADSASIPVLYFLHGYPGKADDPFDYGLAKVLNQRLQDGYAPFIVASLDGNGERHSDTEWANSYNGSELVEDRVIDADIPAVEGSHRRDAAHRWISGFSMGGYGAMNIALHHPAMFSQVVSIAGYFRSNDLSDMFGDRASVTAWNTPDDQVARARGLHILLDEDASDPYSLITGQAPAFAKLLAADHIPSTVNIEPGTHDWSYAMRALTGSLSFLTTGWDETLAPGVYTGGQGTAGQSSGG
jgi:S-formylglutathione hydrolase FrmB